MSRSNESLIDLLLDAPWWVGVLLAIVVYFLFAIVIPSLEVVTPLVQGLQTVLRGIAPIIAFIFLLPAARTAIISWRKRQRLDIQKSLDTIRDLPWQQFEELVAEAYRRQGYTVVENHHDGADGGVDLRLKKGKELHLIQCKSWRTRKIGVRIVRELYGVMAAEHASAGSIVCTGMFTQEAKNFAHGKNIDLVDGDQLEAMIKQVQPVQRVQPTQAEQESVSPVTTPVAPPCPKCGNDLVPRRKQKAKNAWSEFWGCSTFPRCRYTRSHKPQVSAGSRDVGRA